MGSIKITANRPTDGNSFFAASIHPLRHKSCGETRTPLSHLLHTFWAECGRPSVCDVFWLGTRWSPSRKPIAVDYISTCMECLVHWFGIVRATILLKRLNRDVLG